MVLLWLRINGTYLFMPTIRIKLIFLVSKEKNSLFLFGKNNTHYFVTREMHLEKSRTQPYIVYNSHVKLDGYNITLKVFCASLQKYSVTTYDYCGLI